MKKEAVATTPDWFRDKRVTVMGLGLNGGGSGIALWLMRHGAKVTVTDLKDQHALAPSMADLERAFIRDSQAGDKRLFHRFTYILGQHREEDFRDTDMVIKGPGVPNGNAFIAIAEKAGVPVETDVSLFFLLCPFPVIGITGTRGKSTTTSLIADMCRRHDRRAILGGNIRISVMDSLDKLIAGSAKRGYKAPPIVLELSSWMLEGLEPHCISPTIGVITNVKPDHLNRYRNMAHYAATKVGIVRHQGKDDVAVLNADDARVTAAAKRTAAKLRWFSAKPLAKGRDGGFLKNGNLMLRDEGRDVLLVPRNALRIPGEHNVMNAITAAVAAHAAGIPLQHIRGAIRAFKGIPGRIETVAIKKGVTFINDTTATSPDGVIAALRALVDKSFKGNIVLIGGGTDKKLIFGDWAKEVRKQVEHLVLFDGTATVKMEVVLKKAGGFKKMVGARNMAEAVRLAAELAKKGDIVLLSPGCASFGLFINEFDRGDQFVRAVRKMR